MGTSSYFTTDKGEQKNRLHRFRTSVFTALCEPILMFIAPVKRCLQRQPYVSNFGIYSTWLAFTALVNLGSDSCLSK